MSLSEKQEKRFISGRVPKHVRREFKLACIKEDITQQDGLIQALRTWSSIFNYEECERCRKEIRGTSICYVEKGESIKIQGFCSPSCLQDWLKSVSEDTPSRLPL